MSRISPQPHDVLEPEPRRAFREVDVRQAYREQDGCCALCPARLGRRYTRDHILPRELGGATTRANLWLLCPPCDAIKTAADRRRIDKARRLRKREAGQQPKTRSIKSRGFNRGLTRGFDGKVRSRNA